MLQRKISECEKCLLSQKNSQLKRSESSKKQNVRKMLNFSLIYL